MRYILKQTASGFSAHYVVYKNDTVISNAHINNNFVFGGSVQFDSFLDGSIFDMCYKPFDKHISSVAYNVYHNNEVIGRLSSVAEGKFLRAYEYFLFDFFGKTYRIYEVGLGDDGIKYPIYSDDKQIALIEKERVVYNNLDEYEIFAANDPDAFISYIAALYIDQRRYSHHGEKNTSAYEKYYLKTTNKELKAKYDPNFKSKL